MKEAFEKIDQLPAATQFEILFYFISLVMVIGFFLFLGRNGIIQLVRKIITPSTSKIFKDRYDG
jgi:hypothetical protein